MTYDRERLEYYVKHAVADEMRDYRIQLDIEDTPTTCFDDERAALFMTIAERVADKLVEDIKEHRPDSDEADRGDATSGVARSPSAGEDKVSEPDDYVKRLHEDMRSESRAVVSLDLDTVEGLVEARRCVDKHCSDAGHDDRYHAKALRTLDRLLERAAPDRGTSGRDFLAACDTARRQLGTAGVAIDSAAILAEDKDTRIEPPWDDLDPGIRATVCALWDAGYEPTDSGDGSKAGTMGCAIETHHVFMRCEPDDLAKRAWDLWVLVSDWPSSGDYNGNRVEASYSPADGVGVLMLFGCVAP